MDKLPQEIFQHHVLENLDIKDIAALRAVSRSLKFKTDPKTKKILINEIKLGTEQMDDTYFLPLKKFTEWDIAASFFEKDPQKKYKLLLQRNNAMKLGLDVPTKRLLHNIDWKLLENASTKELFQILIDLKADWNSYLQSQTDNDYDDDEKEDYSDY